MGTWRKTHFDCARLEINLLTWNSRTDDIKASVIQMRRALYITYTKQNSHYLLVLEDTLWSGCSFTGHGVMEGGSFIQVTAIHKNKNKFTRVA